MRLKDKIAIVAGGGQGIGEGIVLCLAGAGADIAVVDINAGNAASVADSVKKLGRKALPVTADLTEEEQVKHAVAEAANFFGRIDILVNNVGGMSEATAKTMQAHISALPDALMLPHTLYHSADIWDSYYKLNLKSHVMLSNAVTPHLIKQLSGKIINISSTSGRNPEPDHSPYAAMKAADISLTWSLARALAPYNINVNCVCPGLIYTPLWERGVSMYRERARTALVKLRSRGEPVPAPLQIFADADAAGLTNKELWIKFLVLQNTPLAREQTPDDVGNAVVFFASEQAKNVTGQVLHVDGGYCMR